MYRKIIKELNSFALPLVITNSLNLVLSTLLLMIIGRISVSALVVTSLVDELNYGLLGMFGVGTLCFNIYGARVRKSNPLLFYDYFKSLLQINGYLGMILLVLISSGAPLILGQGYGIDQANLTVGVIYLRISALDLVSTLLIFALSAQLKVRKLTQKMLYVAVYGTMIHLALAYSLVFYVFQGEEQLIGLGIAKACTGLFTCVAYSYLLRQDLKLLSQIKSTKKCYLLKKSGLLFAQECLEGSLTSLLLTGLLSRFGSLIYGTYVLCRQLTTLCLVPMYFYCQALLVLINERLAKSKQASLLRLPLIALGIVLGFYFSSGCLVLLFKESLLALLTDQAALLKQARSFLIGLFLLESSRPFFELAKYSLQALSQEKQVLKSTVKAQLWLLISLILSYFIGQWSFYLILRLTALYNVLLGVTFYWHYRHHAKQS